MAGVLAAAGAVALAGLPAASAAPAQAGPAVSGSETFQIMSTGVGTNHKPVIAVGLFTAGGRNVVVSSSTDRLVFAGGSFKVRFSKPQGPQSFSPLTCLLDSIQHGTYTIGHGAGAYAGISGHGKYQLIVLAVSAKGAGGQCDRNAKPVATETELEAQGPASR
jgi:hypothetical protein